MKKKLMTLEQRRLLREAQQLLALSERQKARKKAPGGVGIRRQHEYNGSPDETGYGFSDETL